MSTRAQGMGVVGMRLAAAFLLVAMGVGSGASGTAAALAEPSSPGPVTGEGEAALLDRIAEHFRRTLEEVKALQAQGYGIGEIMMAYGLASAASLVPPDKEGASFATFDEALSEVLRLRQAGLGWGEIARKLGVHPGTLGESVAGVVSDAERKAGELQEAAGRAAANVEPRMRELGEQLRRAALVAAESARELLPDEARRHFLQALDEMRRGLEAAPGARTPDGRDGAAGSGSEKTVGPGGQAPHGAPKGKG